MTAGLLRIGSEKDDGAENDQLPRPPVHPSVRLVPLSKWPRADTKFGSEVARKYPWGDSPIKAAPR